MAQSDPNDKAADKEASNDAPTSDVDKNGVENKDQDDPKDNLNDDTKKADDKDSSECKDETKSKAPLPPFLKKRGHGKKRTKQEIEYLNTDDGAIMGVGVHAVKDNAKQWIATILGPANTPYDGGTFKVNIQFTNDYPSKPPKLTMKTAIWHPNINKHGQICFGIIDNWENNKTIWMRDVLLEILHIFEKPDLNDVINPEAAAQYRFDKNAFDEKVKDIIKQNQNNN